MTEQRGEQPIEQQPASGQETAEPVVSQALEPGGSIPPAKRTARRSLDAAEADAVVEAVEALDSEPATPAVPAPVRRPRRSSQGAGSLDLEPEPPVVAGTEAAFESSAVDDEEEIEEVAGFAAATVSADYVDVTGGAIGQAEADEINVRFGAVGFAHGEQVSVEKGGIGGAIGNNVSLSQGGARLIVGRDVRVRQGGAGTVLAADVTFEGQSGAFVVFAARTNGEVRTLLDWRGALILGGVLALLGAMFRGRLRQKR